MLRPTARILAILLTAGAVLPIWGGVAVAKAPATRSCGTIWKGYPIQARASRNVSCGQARRILPKVINGSAQCFYGPAQFHPCRLEGFYCTQGGKGEQVTARCVKGRKLIVGQAG